VWVKHASASAFCYIAAGFDPGESMLETLRTIAKRVKSEAGYYRLLLGHPDTPRSAKLMLGAALAYALSPVDLIPDFIPVLGQLDDLIVVPTLILLALYLIPEQAKDDSRRALAESPPTALTPESQG